MTKERQKPHDGAICGDVNHDDRSAHETARQSVGGPATLYGSTYGETPAPSPDNVAVDRFAEALKQKLAMARAKGRGGWQTCSKEDLSRMLREHVEKGDPRDVANFCMFLWSLGHGIAPAAQGEPVDFVSLLEEAERIVRGKPLWKRFISGTPLENDVPVWMANFAQQFQQASKPMTASEIWASDAIMEVNADAQIDMATIVRFVRAVERHHNIKE